MGSRQLIRTAAIASCALLAWLAAAGPASARTLLVETTADGGPGSLREAVATANADPEADRIEFAAGLEGTIELREALPVVTAPLRLTGPGAGRLAISGGGAVGLFDVELGGEGEARLEGLTLRDGSAADGGAIVAFDSKLVLARVTMTGNRASNAGGAVNATGGGLTVIDSRLEGNSASYPGGAIQAQGTALRISGTTVAGNTAGSSGGGVYVAEPGSRSIVEGSTIEANSAGGDGGGVAIGGSPYATLQVSDSKIEGNFAEGEGDDVYPPHERPSSGGAGDDDGRPAMPPASAGSNGTTTAPSAAATARRLLSVPLGTSQADGPTAMLLDGIALEPPGAPPAVQAAIDAANSISHLPYIWGGGHASWFAPGYDCSGAVSFALYGGGLLSVPLTSGQLASWGAPGPGRWITIYANASHVYAVIAGLRWDTAGQASGSGPRWHVEPASTAGFVVRHPPGY